MKKVSLLFISILAPLIIYSNEIIIGTGTAIADWPYFTLYQDSKCDMLYTASDIINAGGFPGNITRLAFNVNLKANPATMNGMQIIMQNTTLTSLSGLSISGGTTVYSASWTIPGTGWQFINFSTPFIWDGTSNILIEICFNNTTSGNASQVYGITTTDVMVYHRYMDEGAGCSLTMGQGYGANRMIRPNIDLTFNPSGPPPPPNLLIPADNLAGVSLTPTLDWSNSFSASSYRVQVSTSNTFSALLVNVSNLTSSIYTVPSSVLSFGTIYYWRVNASNTTQSGSTQTGSWSTIRSFTTIGYLYQIITSANPTPGGSTGGGSPSFIYGQTATLTATPVSGYFFSNWTEGGQVVCTQTPYVFSVISSRTLVANFIQYTYPPPTNLQAAVTANNVHLTWEAPTGNTATLNGYNVYRATTKLNSSPITNLYYDNTGLAVGNYSYTVKAVYGTMESSAVGPVSVTIVANPAPVTLIPTKGVPDGTLVLIPVTVRNFTNITGIALRLEYDPTILTFAGSSDINPLIPDLLVVDNHISESLHKIILSWYGDTQTLAINSKLVDINFTYISGTSALTWNNDANSGGDCEYADAVGNALIDTPTAQFYYNGEVHFQAWYKISGNYYYNNTSNTPLDNVKVVLKQGTNHLDSVFTNTAGYYEFNNLPDGIYTLQSTTIKSWAGVDATDVIKIQNHYTGLEILTEPVKLYAADVNQTNTINSTDAIKVKRRIAGSDPSFTRGNWTFARPTLGSDTVVINGSDVTQNIYGLCVGDVNASNNPAPGYSPGVSGHLIKQSDAEFNIGNEERRAK